MKLFENKVGRPSNEILRKRKLFIIIVAVLSLILLSCFVLFAAGTEKIKGSSYKSNDVGAQFSSTATVTKDGSTTTIKLKLNKKGSKVKEVKVIACRNLEDCTYDKPWDISRNDMGLIHWAGSSEILNISTSVSSFDTYYLRVTTHSKTNSDKSNNYQLDKTYYKITPKTKQSSKKYTYNVEPLKLTLTCPAQVKKGEFFSCHADQRGVLITVVNTKYLSSSLEKSTLTTSWNLSKQMRFEKDGTYEITATKEGYVSASKMVKVVTPPNATTTTTKFKTMKLNCPSEAYVNEHFTCTAELAGVKITAIHTLNLAKGYTTTFTTTSTDKVKNLKYTKPGTISVTAYKEGYNVVKKDIVIKSKSGSTTTKPTATTTKPTTASTTAPKNTGYVKSVTKSGLTLTCPAEANVYEEFRCRTNLVGAKISVTTSGLRSGLKSSYTTTKSNRTLYLMYTSVRTITVTAKSGSTSVSLSIPIVNSKNSSNSSKFNIDCPSEAYVNELFVCGTSKVGAKITIPSANLNRTTVKALSHVANAGSRIKLLKYTKAGNVTVTFTNGNQKYTKTVKIINK